MALAEAAGVRISAFRLEIVLNRPVVMARRFDRRDGWRIPCISAVTPIDATDHELRSYLEIAEFLRREGSKVNEDLNQLWSAGCRQPPAGRAAPRSGSTSGSTAPGMRPEAERPAAPRTLPTRHLPWGEKGPLRGWKDRAARAESRSPRVRAATETPRAVAGTRADEHGPIGLAGTGSAGASSPADSRITRSRLALAKGGRRAQEIRESSRIL